MATIDAYGVKFIGNDFVQPRARRPEAGAQYVHRPVAAVQPRYVQQQPTQQPVYEQAVPVEAYEPVASDFEAQLEPAAPAVRTFRVSNLLTIRNGVIATAAAALIAGAVITVPHASAILSTTRSVTHRIALGASVDLHHTKPRSFTMPQNSILVKNAQLSTFVDAIEGQEVDITAGGSTVTAKPLDLQKWFMTTAGPQSGSTILEANTANISAYLTALAQKQAPGTSSDAVANATSQLAQSIMKYNGADVTLAD